ncbi:thioredoxin family protein [Betaproteobacteria bacterium]|nr:thioredoxin family protein [Betaproteobacteria bacterium]
MTEKPKLTLVGRAYCHLCHEMAAALTPLLAEYGVDLEILDADADPALERYDELVPVLLWGEQEICHYFLDEAGVRAVLTKAVARAEL